MFDIKIKSKSQDKKEKAEDRTKPTPLVDEIKETVALIELKAIVKYEPNEDKIKEKMTNKIAVLIKLFKISHPQNVVL